MSHPWAEFFQLGVVVSAFYPEIRERKGPILRVLKELASDPFFQAMEFSGAEEPSVQEEVVALLKQNKKTLVFSGGSYCYQGQYNLHDLEEEKRREALRNVQRVVDEAVKYGCKILYIMGLEAPASPERARALENFSRSMRALGEYARQKNFSAPLTISVENFYILRQAPFLIGPTREAGQMLRNLRRDHPNLGLTFDTSHILDRKSVV